MKKIMLLLSLTACVLDKPAQPRRETKYEVVCPINTIQSVTDTLVSSAREYYYHDSSLTFYDETFRTIKQYPTSCVVKEIK